MTKEKESSYHFKVGEEGRERLNLVNKLNNNSSFKFMHDLNLLKPGMTVLDLGCGTGQIAIWLAKQVMPAGKVIAIDNNEKQIDISRKAAKEAKADIEFHVVCINDIDSLNLNGSIDLVFARFFFMHLVEPQNVLNNIKHILKPETGTIVMQEHISSHMFSYPESPALKKLINLAAKLNKHLNKDNNLGLKLLELYKNAGLKVLDYQYNNSLAKTEEEKLIFYRSLAEATPVVLKNNLATEEEVNELKNGLRDFAKTEDNLVSGMPTLIVAGINLTGEQYISNVTDLE